MKTKMNYICILILLICGNSISVCQPAITANPSGDYIFSISIISRPLEVIVQEGAYFNNLRHDILYQTVASDAGIPSNIYPSAKDEEFIPGRIEISGNPSDDVSISFQLPSRIYETSGDNTYIYMTYNNLSASTLNQQNGNQQFFDPRVGTRITLPADGSNAMILIGGNPIVPNNAPPGEYVGTGIVSVGYTGGS